jgi:hypothetical protein
MAAFCRIVGTEISEKSIAVLADEYSGGKEAAV